MRKRKRLTEERASVGFVGSPGFPLGWSLVRPGDGVYIEICLLSLPFSQHSRERATAAGAEAMAYAGVSLHSSVTATTEHTERDQSHEQRHMPTRERHMPITIIHTGMTYGSAGSAVTARRPGGDRGGSQSRLSSPRTDKRTQTQHTSSRCLRRLAGLAPHTHTSPVQLLPNRGFQVGHHPTSTCRGARCRVGVAHPASGHLPPGRSSG